MNVKIKVCGMRDASNITDLTALGPDYMGFIFYGKSPRDVSDVITFDMIDSLPENIEPVAVVVNMPLHEMVDLEELGFSTIQLHGQESPEVCQALMDHEFTVVKVFSVGEEFDFTQLEEYAECVDYFLFDTKGKQPGGNGVQFDWSLLKDYNYDKPFFLSGGIGPEDIKTVQEFKHPQFYAIDVNSGFESEPGLKNIKSLKQTVFNELNQQG